jgi:hypothetical protein
LVDQHCKEGSLPGACQQTFMPWDPVKYQAGISSWEAAHTKPLTQAQKIEFGFKEQDEQRAQRGERWVTTDGTMTPIEGNVRKVSPTNQASSEALDASAEQIAHYNAPPLSGFAMARGQGPEIMKRIKEINPDYNAQKYQVAQRVRNDFASGAQTAKAIDATNTVVHHLSVFDDLGKALGNHDVNAINRVINYAQAELGHPEVTDFNTAKGIIADEVIKAVTGSGAVFDREEMQRQLTSARSPEQLKHQADDIRRLMAGRLGAYYQRWHSVPLPDDEFTAKLEPETIEGVRGYAPSNLKKALGEGEKDAGPSGAASSQGAPQGGASVPAAADFQRLGAHELRDPATGKYYHVDRAGKVVEGRYSGQ